MPPVALRPVADSDDAFMRQVFASSREDELAALPESLHALFVDSQYDLQRAHYRRVYPGATWSVIVLAGEPVGRLVVDRTIDPWLLVDIAIVAAARNRGIGTGLIRELLDEARRAGRVVALTVRVSNTGAIRAYDRLGFVRRATDDDGVYITMASGEGKGWAE